MKHEPDTDEIVGCAAAGAYLATADRPEAVAKLREEHPEVSESDACRMWEAINHYVRVQLDNAHNAGGDASETTL